MTIVTTRTWNFLIFELKPQATFIYLLSLDNLGLEKPTCLCVCKHVKLPQSGLTLCFPMDCSLPASPVHGILQARILEWLTIPPPEDLPDPGIKPMSLMFPVLAGESLPLEPSGNSHIYVYSCNFVFIVNRLIVQC